MKKILTAILILICFTTCSFNSQAEPRIDIIRNGGFMYLSTEDMEDTIDAIVQEMRVNAGIEHEMRTSCFYWEEYAVLAYNTLYTYKICVNLSGFDDSVDADLCGETVEYHLIKTLAHEVRHSYQWEHRNDDTDYGRWCKQGFEDYISYDGTNKESYYAQFIEQDANIFAKQYADLYFGLN